MTSQEFVIWLKGFTEGVHEYNITPKQWDLLKEKLGQVIGDDNKFVEAPRFPFGTPDTTPYTPDTTPIKPVIDPFPKWQYPHYPNPLDNPFKVTCDLTGSGTTYTPGFAVTTTPNTQGYITTYNPITFTTTGRISGSNVTYTTSGPNGTTVTYVGGTSDEWNIKNKDLLHD
jgi:hypothetical protein